MSSYRIDIQSPNVTLRPCEFKASSVPGKTLCLNIDGASLVVLPDGTERPPSADHPTGPWEPASSPNWDSLYTQAEVRGDLLVYDVGVPRAYRMVV